MGIHPTGEQLWAYVEARVHASRTGTTGARAVARHLSSGCRACRRRADEYEKLHALLRGPRLAVAPEARVARARDEIRALRRPAGRAAREAARNGHAPDGIRGMSRPVPVEIVGALVLDSFTSPASAGIRRGKTPARTLLFESAAGEVYLSVHQGEGKSVELRGLLVPTRDVHLGEARAVLQRGERRAVRRIDEKGAFRYGRVGKGPVHLSLHLDDRILRLASFEL